MASNQPNLNRTEGAGIENEHIAEAVLAEKMTQLQTDLANVSALASKTDQDFRRDRSYLLGAGSVIGALLALLIWLTAEKNSQILAQGEALRQVQLSINGALVHLQLQRDAINRLLDGAGHHGLQPPAIGNR